MPGSDIYLHIETLYRSESCKGKLRKTLACGPPGMATQVIKHVIHATGIMPSPADPPCCCFLHFLHLFCLSVIIGGQIGAAYLTEGEPMFGMQLPSYAEVQVPNCDEETPMFKITNVKLVVYLFAYFRHQ